MVEQADGTRRAGRGRPPLFVRLDPAAGVVVGKLGTATVSPEELTRALNETRS